MSECNITLPEKYSWVKIDDSYFSTALDKCLNSKRNLFINGRAGSGKSLIIKILSSMKKNVVVMSTTGLTAQNLCVDNIVASTPYSLLMITPVEIIPSSDLTKTSRKMSEIIRKASIIVIDEVSMMSNQLFDFIIKKIKMIRKTVPRIILFGDPMQLSPVLDETNAQVLNFYENEYGGNVMFFNSHSFLNMNFETLNLRRSYRQRDPLFERVLHNIGYNEFDQSDIDYINQKVMLLKDFERDHKNYIQLCPTNSMVSKINSNYLSKIRGKEYQYTAQITGQFPESKLNNDRVLKIKVGAQVMCVINKYESLDNPGSDYRNGTIGTVLECHPDHIIIEKSDGNLTKVLMSKINNYELFVDSNGDISYKIIGTFTQLDAKVMKALTIHKSQGKSLESAYICLNRFVPEGLVYVALSRLKTLDGLGLSIPVEPWMIKYNTESFDFFQK